MPVEFGSNDSSSAAGSALRDALAAERESRYLDSFSLCDRALKAEPGNPDALNLMGRLCKLGGDLAGAIALQRMALRIDAGHARARNDLAIAQDAVPSRSEGAALFAQAVERAPDVACHHRAPAAIKAFDGMDEVKALLERAVTADPSHAQAHAALGNVLVRENRPVGAPMEYQRAIMLDPELADAQLALAELLHLLHDDEQATQQRDAALARRRIFSACPSSAHAAHRVLMLMRPAPYSANAPLDLVVNHARIAMHRLYLGGPQPPHLAGLPAYDVVFNAMGYYESAHEIIDEAAAFIAAQRRPAINDPRRLAATARERLAQTLHGIDGCIVPVSLRLLREEIAARIVFPALVRPIDTHAGKGLELIADAAQLAGYLAREPAPVLHVTPFVDYKLDDGYYRKYRVIVVDGVAYPYHLAISPNWMVHYNNSPMKDHAWMRDEELRFLTEPRDVFPQWDTLFSRIARAVGLDYFGLDLTRTPEGAALIFEADAAMLVHDLDPPEPFAYKQGPVHAVFAAVEAMIAGWAVRSDRPGLQS